MTKQHKEQPFNLYGIRETRNDKYMSITLVWYKTTHTFPIAHFAEFVKRFS